MPGVSKKYKTKCDKCNEYFSNRQFNKHYLSCKGLKKKEKEYVNCPYCYNYMEKKNLNRHIKKCNVEREAPELFSFLDFLFTLVMKINVSILKNGYDDISKRNLIYNKRVEYIKENIENGELENKLLLEEEKKNKNTYLHDNKILLNSIIKNKKVEEYELDLPQISFRQLLIDYIYKYTRGTTMCHKISKRVFEYIIDKYGKKNDYKLDKEINNIEIFSLRINNEYFIEKRNYLFQILDKYIMKRDELRCLYCGKYVLYKFKHLLTCEGFKEKYDDNKNIMIKEVLTTFLIKEYQNSDKELYTIEKEFDNKDSKDFIKNIKVFLNKKRYRDFRYDQKIKKENNKNNIFSILNRIEELKTEIKQRKNGYDEDKDINVPKKVLDEIDNKFKLKKIHRVFFKKINKKNYYEDIINEINEINIEENKQKKDKFIIEYIDDKENEILNNKPCKIEENNKVINYEENMKYLYNQKINGEEHNLIKMDTIFNKNEKNLEEIKFKENIYLNIIKNKYNKI